MKAYKVGRVGGENTKLLHVFKSWGVERKCHGSEKREGKKKSGEVSYCPSVMKTQNL